MPHTNTQANISRAVEAGASTKDINTLLQRSGKVPLNVIEGTPVDRDIPVGQDLLVELGEQDSDELAVLEHGPVGRAETKKTRDRNIGEAAIIAADLDNVGEIEAGLRLDSSPRGVKGSEILREQSNRQFGAEVDLIKEVANTNLPIDILDSMDRAVAVDQMIREEETLASREVAPAIALVRALASPITSPDEKLRTANRLFFAKKLSELADDIGIGEFIGEFAMELLPLKTIIDNKQLTQTFDTLAQGDQIENLVVGFKRLPAEQQRDVFDSIEEVLLEVLPRGRTLEILTAMTDPTVDEAALRQEFELFGTLDTVLSVIEIGLIAKGMLKAMNAIKLAKQLKNIKKASELNLATLADESGEILAKADIDQVTAYDNSMPIHQAEFQNAIAEGLAPEMQKRILDFKKTVDSRVGDIAEGKNFQREGLVDVADAAVVEKRLNDLFESEIVAKLDQPELVSTVTKIESDAESITLKFEIVDQNNVPIDKGSFTQKLTLSDVGTWETPRETWTPNWIGSPKFKSASSNLVESTNGAIRLDAVEQRVARELRQIVKGVTGKIKGNKSRRVLTQEVDTVLLYGDDIEHVFTPAELRAGVGGIPFNDTQVEAYYRLRAAFDGLGDLQDAEIGRLAKLRGVKTIRVHNVDEKIPFWNGEVKDTPDIARGSLGAARKVYSPDFSRPFDVEDLDFDALYSTGFRLVKLEDTMEIAGVGNFRHILSSVDDITELRRGYLTRKVGYVPRANKNTVWFVQQFKDTEIDGRPAKSRSVERAFDNRVDAQIFAARKVDANTDRTVDFRAVQDRELEQLSVGSSGLTSRGGLFFGPRREERIPFGLPEQDLGVVARRGALESISLYSENLKNLVTRNEWRMGAIRKWENTAAAMFPEQGRISYDDFAQVQGKLSGKENIDFLNDWRQQINEWSGFRSKEEMWWPSAVQRIYDGVLKVPGVKRGATTNVLSTLRHKDPFAALRSSAFHTLLGAFNPIQLFVQAQGATISVGILANRPLKLVNTLLRRQVGLSYLQHFGKHIDSVPGRNIARLMGFKPKEAKMVKELWDRSGLYDAMFVNADIEASVRGFPTGRSALRWIFDKGLLWYRAGEGFNRRMAFLTALADPGVDIAELMVDSNKFRKVLTRSNDILLNLTKANRAVFQKGWKSVPTQFMQVITKTHEQILSPLLNKRNNQIFTFGERWRILLTQLGLYGAAGIPLGTMAMRGLMDMMGTDQVDVNDKDNTGIVKAANGGMYDYLAWQAGMDIEVGNRASLVQGFNDLILSIATDSENALEYLAGPALTAPDAFINSLIYTAGPAILKGWSELSVNEMSGDQISDTIAFMAENTLDLVGSPFATWRNHTKAKWMENLDKSLNKQGKTVSERDFKVQEEWAVRLGFRIGDDVRARDLTKIEAERQEYINDISDAMLNVWNKQWMMMEIARKDGKRLGETQRGLYDDTRRALSMGTDDPLMREQIVAAYNRKRANQARGSSQLSKAVRQSQMNHSEDLASEYINLNNRLAPARENLHDEETE